MENTETTFGDFLAAVDALREDDTTVRTTAHTASVSAEDWTSGPSASGVLV